jgi:uncharacterized membrane protein YphA (DoxX/SURF4 family)
MTRRLPPPVDRIDQRITAWMADHGITFMRLALAGVFLWFGALKLIPGLSPAASLAGRTVVAMTAGIVPYELAIPAVGLLEILIGIGFLTGSAMRATILLLGLQMIGALAPLVLFPAETWTVFPIAPTLEGQYIIKNAVLIAGAVVVGATVRGGVLSPDPRPSPQAAPIERSDYRPSPLA